MKDKVETEEINMIQKTSDFERKGMKEQFSNLPSSSSHHKHVLTHIHTLTHTQTHTCRVGRSMGGGHALAVWLDQETGAEAHH